MTLAVNIAQSAANNVTMRNRIINPGMVIDQRNAGASVSIASGAQTYTLDRYVVYNNSTNTFTVQQSSTAPAGFSRSLLVTNNASATSNTSTMYQLLGQRVEGNNIADLNWGTANASSVTISFWVYTSQAGTYGGVLRNGANNRFYGFSFTVAANTWSQVRVTVAGDTSGTWATDNTTGVELLICLSCGSSFTAAAGAWSGTQILGITGQTQFNATGSATFFITGVQLEKGTAATAFEQRLYGTELSLCQRYLPAFSGAGQVPGCGNFYNTQSALISIQFPVQTRTAPTGVTAVNVSSYAVGVAGISADVALSTLRFNQATTLGALIYTDASSAASSGGSVATLRATSSNALFYFTGCEL
jgi:hypothetical protein